MKHDKFGPRTFDVWHARYAKICNRSCEPEMILELNSVNRHVLQFNLFECKNILSAKDTGCFVAFIQTAVGSRATHFERKSSPNGLSNVKCFMAKHATFDRSCF